MIAKPTDAMKVLVVGATGSIGQLVLQQALREGCAVRALVRDAAQAARLPAGVEVTVGDLTRAATLRAAVEGIDGIVFTHGSNGRAPGPEAVDREPIVEIRAGDVIWCPPGHKHWHGATPTTAMTHIAIQEALDGVAVVWMDKVTDAQYLAGPPKQK